MKLQNISRMTRPTEGRERESEGGRGKQNDILKRKSRHKRSSNMGKIQSQTKRNAQAGRDE